MNLKFMFELLESMDHLPVFDLGLFHLPHTVLAVLQFPSLYTFCIHLVKEFSVSKVC